MKLITVRNTILLLSLISGFLFSQKSKTDSLYKRYLTLSSDTQRIKAMIQLGNLYQNLFIDSAVVMADRAVWLSTKLNNFKLLTDACILKAMTARQKGEIDTAEKFARKGIEAANKINYLRGLGNSKFQLAVCLKRIGRFNDAIALNTEIIQLAEKINEKQLALNCYNSIGNIYSAMYNEQKALEYYEAGQKLAIEWGVNIDLVGEFKGNIVAVYVNTGQWQKAKETMLPLIKIYDDLNDIERKAFCRRMMAMIYAGEKNWNEAIRSLKEALVFYEQAQLQNEIGDVYGQMGSVEWNMAYENNRDKKLFNTGIEHMKLALKYSFESKDAELTQIAYYGLVLAFSKFEDYKSAFEYLKLNTKFNDSLLNEKVRKSAIETEQKFQNVQKQKEIEIQKTQITLVSAEHEKEKTQKTAFAIGLALTALLLILVIFGYGKIKKAKAIVSLQKLEVEEQKKLVDEKQKEILDSIYYAKRIQKASMASEKYIGNAMNKLKK